MPSAMTEGVKKRRLWRGVLSHSEKPIDESWPITIGYIL
jgi:hypothetical protein